MGLNEAMLCMALSLGMGTPGETPYVHVVSQAEMETHFCGEGCQGMYIPLRSRFNGSRFSVVLSEQADAKVFMTELAEFVRHANSQPRQEPEGGDLEGPRASQWAAVCPELEDGLNEMIAEGGTPLPDYLSGARAWTYAGDLGAATLRDQVLQYEEQISRKNEDRPLLAEEVTAQD